MAEGLEERQCSGLAAHAERCRCSPSPRAATACSNRQQQPPTHRWLGVLAARSSSHQRLGGQGLHVKGGRGLALRLAAPAARLLGARGGRAPCRAHVGGVAASALGGRRGRGGPAVGAGAPAMGGDGIAALTDRRHDQQQGKGGTQLAMLAGGNMRRQCCACAGAHRLLGAGLQVCPSAAANAAASAVGGGRWPPSPEACAVCWAGAAVWAAAAMGLERGGRGGRAALGSLAGRGFECGGK